MKKNSCTPINRKKYSCYSLKKIHMRNLITKKKFLRLKNSPPTLPPPPPPIIFLMVRPFGQTNNESNPSSTEPIIFPLVCPGSYPWSKLMTCTSCSSFTTFFFTLLHTYFDHAVYHLFIPLHLRVWLTDSPKMRKSGTPTRQVFEHNFRTGISH